MSGVSEPGPGRLDPATPVLVGTGQVSNRVTDVTDAREPAELIVDAARQADVDAGGSRSVLGAVDVVGVAQIVSWRYPDPGRVIASRLGIEPTQSVTTTTGGNSPQMLLNHLAGEIQGGRVRAALLCGGEAIDSRWRAMREKVWLEWPEAPEGEPDRVLGDDRPGSHAAEVAVGLDQPIAVYPLLESAVRASTGASVAVHQRHISELWSRFSAVAAANPYAWSRTPRTAEEIRTVSPTNRMIGFPYPKLMNSRIDVDQAAAVLLCSVEVARDLRIPSDQWVFPQAGADGADHYWVSEREFLSRSPAVRFAARSALKLAGVGIDDVAQVDLYSCFPSAVQIAATELGLGLDRPLTVTGGLGFAGGPANNYVTHSIATMVDRLRGADGAFGLCTAIGWYVTKNSVGVYSSRPPAGGFRHVNVQREVDATPRRALAEGYEGPVTIEAYTVMHDRDGSPWHGVASGLTSDGARTWTQTDEPALVQAMTHEDWCGRAAAVRNRELVELPG
ncbi:MAG: acetyl-CoA acetyltransferase [Acidimicrobiia bacterium]